MCNVKYIYKNFPNNFEKSKFLRILIKILKINIKENISYLLVIDVFILQVIYYSNNYPLLNIDFSFYVINK